MPRGTTLSRMRTSRGIGDQTHSGAIAAFGTANANYTQLLTVQHSTFTDGGPVTMASRDSHTNFLIDRNIWTRAMPGSIAPYCASWGEPSSVDGGSSFLLTNNSCLDAIFGVPNSGSSHAGSLTLRNISGQPNTFPTALRWNAFRQQRDAHTPTGSTHWGRNLSQKAT